LRPVTRRSLSFVLSSEVDPVLLKVPPDIGHFVPAASVGKGSFFPWLNC
jgi:hypothetical protein